MVAFYGGVDKVPFSKTNCNNEIGKERKKYLESNDAKALLEYLKNKQREDPTFFYKIQVDEKDGQIANFFGQMVSPLWITHALVMLYHLTPRLIPISSNCLSLQSLVPTITSRQ